MISTKEFEDDIGVLLDCYFEKYQSVHIRVRKNLKYRSEIGFRSYSPLIDLTVGPFSEERGVSLYHEYDQLIAVSQLLMNDLISAFRENYQTFGEGYFRINERNLPRSYEDFLSVNPSVNWNARCFLAIEVGDNGSHKHLLGDIINASVSGRVGLVIGFNEEKLASYLRNLEYLAYTAQAEKIVFNSKNILVLKPSQLEKAILKNLPEG